MDQNSEPPRITFEGEEFQRPAQSFQTQTPKIVQWVIKYSGGYVKDEKQATYVLIGFVIVALFFVFILMFKGTAQAPSETQMKQIIKNQQNAHAPVQ